MPIERWTEAMKRAVPYIESAFGRGLRVTEAMEQYRAGGGAIRTQDWGNLYQAYREAEGVQTLLATMPPETGIPRAWYFEEDINFMREFVRKVQFVPVFEGEIVGEPMWRWIESDSELTLDEWDMATEEIIMQGKTPGMIESYTIIKSHFSRRAPQWSATPTEGTP